ncbi:hypothetical protein [Allocoleopsis franciscana]|uniref:hypothetical protein n=1 Tax=Allocoleopsis franciscana TaxID=2886352 RepID=UPI001C1151E9|nr:hypothetical protein [Allocoleopsis franciscana]
MFFTGIAVAKAIRTNAPKLIVNPSFCNVLTVVAVAIRGRLSRSICPKRLFVNDYEVINQYIIDLENNVVICNPCHPTHSADWLAHQKSSIASQDSYRLQRMGNQLYTILDLGGYWSWATTPWHCFLGLAALSRTSKNFRLLFTSFTCSDNN